MHKAPDHDRTQRLRRTAETTGQSGPHEIYDWQTRRRFNRKVDYRAKSRANLTDQSNSVTATRTFARREWVGNTHLGAKPLL
jgi:hypothetical protein